MKKSISNLGKTLNKTEQKQINGAFDLILCIKKCSNLYLPYDFHQYAICEKQCESDNQY